MSEPNPIENPMTRRVPASIGSPDEAVRPEAELVTHVRRAITIRRRRQTRFPSGLFGEPAWDILLDLFVAEAEARVTAVTTACAASGVPLATALRYISRLVENGMITRVADTHDRRRIFIELTPKARDAIQATYRFALCRV